VAIAAREREVRKVIEVARLTIIRLPNNPTLPTTQPNRRYIITPRIVRIDGVKTPAKVLSPEDLTGLTFFLFLFPKLQ
jgi:hypothetical protein